MQALFTIALVLVLIGGLWTLVAAFRVHFMWAVLIVIMPLTLFVFALMEWETAKKPFVWWMAGVVLGGIAVAKDPSVMNVIR
jgi:hypothetical protein